MPDRTPTTATLLNGAQDPRQDMSPAGASQWELWARQDALLDAAVQETFPASDAVAVMRLL